MSEYDGIPASYDSWRLRVPPEGECDGSCLIRCGKCEVALAVRIPVCEACERVLWSEHRAGPDAWEAVDVTEAWAKPGDPEWVCRACAEKAEGRRE